MNTSERVNLTREIANRLSTEDWNIIELTLEQFNFRRLNSFDGERLEYVIKRIQNGDENKLIELGLHLNIPVRKSEGFSPTFWKENFFRIFISHVASNKEVAIKLRDDLEKFAISSFVAHEDIKPSKEW